MVKLLWRTVRALRGGGAGIFVQCKGFLPTDKQDRYFFQVANRCMMYRGGGGYGTNFGEGVPLVLQKPDPVLN